MLFIPVQYGKLKYPGGISPKIIEVPCHFDILGIATQKNYSLHTEYSYGKRKFRNPSLEKLKEISSANYKGIPLLWFSKRWAIEFADFILYVTAETDEPEYIEIHPPFNDYSNIEKFLELYKLFEERIQMKFANAKILLENRTGTTYTNGKFIVSSLAQVIEFLQKCRTSGVKLELALDIPALITAERRRFRSIQGVSEIIDALNEFKGSIAAFHLWGKTRGGGAHGGDLNILFKMKIDIKEYFLTELFRVFSDGKKRYFLPEINTNSEDLRKLLDEIKAYGAKFV
ncbi:MAG: hypothetical protein QXP56_05275 [Archaeoglobaceae archaeon]